MGEFKKATASITSPDEKDVVVFAVGCLDLRIDFDLGEPVTKWGKKSKCQSNMATLDKVHSQDDTSDSNERNVLSSFPLFLF